MLARKEMKSDSMVSTGSMTTEESLLECQKAFFEDEAEIDFNDAGFKLPLFNKNKQQQIGLIALRQIQCKRRTSFLNLIAD